MSISAKCFCAALTAFALVGFVPGMALAEDIQAFLTGTDLQPDATGLATYKPDLGGGGGAPRGGRGLEIAVDAIDLTDTVYVLINGNFVVSISIIATHGGSSLETDQGDDIPDIQPGDLMEVTDLDGNTLLVGVF